MGKEVKLSEADIHPHLRARMLQRGVTKEEIEETLYYKLFKGKIVVLTLRRPKL